MSEVRTRFAPSPTGELHIGGARTALFNMLFARRFGGDFILRIDDTDAERSRREFERGIMRDLRWLGIDWDVQDGADKNEPTYRQSERLAIYSHWAGKLLESGAAYPCYCSQQRLDDLRESQLASGQPPRYDGACRHLTQKQRAELEASGVKPCLRFALPDAPVEVNDVLRGPYRLTDAGDFVIMRSVGGGEGSAMYMFASAIDDHLMGITHIIRGDEHLPNAARQKAIFDALGWETPAFAHIPMILGQDRHKLSKRTGSEPVARYAERGFYPQALCAYLATLSWTPPDGCDTFDLKSLAAAFDLGGVSCSSPVHDETRLLHYQREVMSRVDPRDILDGMKKLEPRFAEIDETAAAGLIDDMRREYATVRDIATAAAYLFNDAAKCEPEGWFAELGAELSALPEWNAESLNSCMRGWQKAHGMKPREFFHPLRAALTGEEKGAALPLVLAAMGRGRVCGILTTRR